LVLGSQGNSYRGETTIQQGALRVRYQTNASNVGMGRIGDGNGRVNLSGGTLEYNGSTPSSIRTVSITNPVRVTADSEIDYASTTTGLTGATDPSGVIFDFASNANGDAFDWTGGTLKFRHNGASGAITYRPSFSRTGFTYAGPVVIDNGAGTTRRTVLQSTNTSGTQTWSGDITGSGSFLRDGANGTTVLSGNNDYHGDTTVNGGILSLTHANLFDAADVYLSGLTDPNAKLNLNFAGTDTIDQLFINNSSQVIGEWGAPGSGAANTSPFISGTGRLLVSAPGSGSGFVNDTSAVPEPAALSLVLLAIGPAMALRRRKR
jgi:autotransporter-associated beta strand protein